MSNMNINMNAEIRTWQEKLFARSIRRRRKLERLAGMIGKTSNLHCLEISAGDGIISASLRSLGGSWKTAVATKDAADSVGYCLNESITLIAEGKLPFDDNMFDRVVIVDALKEIAADYDFIHECHRVLKNAGWVVISETRRTPFGLVSLFKRMCGVSPIAKGQPRNGYKVRELFNILKDGFDVPETICYSNSLLESAATIGELVQKSLGHEPYWMVHQKGEKEQIQRYRRLHSLAVAAYPLTWLISKLEFLPGHKLLVKSRRRIWRPRLQPKLLDGRSIAEAAINTKIGTAAPF